jgi:hypothetical protein
MEVILNVSWREFSMETKERMISMAVSTSGRGRWKHGIGLYEPN